MPTLYQAIYICTSHDILDGFQYRLGLRSKKENIYFSRSALEFSPGQKKKMTHNDFLPLADISDKAREAEKSKEGQKFCQPQDPETKYFDKHSNIM